MQVRIFGAIVALALNFLISANAQQIRWSESYQAAIAGGKTTDKLVMALFVIDGTPVCKRLDAEVLSDPMVADMTLRFVPVRIETSKDKKLSSDLAVTSVPMVLFIDPQTGNVDGKILGVWPPGEFAAQMGRVATAHRTYTSTLARYEADPKDVKAALDMVAIYSARGNKDRAVRAFAQAAKAGASPAQASKTCNDAGDTFQIAGSPDKALSFFKGAIAANSDPESVAYAEISVASCYRSLLRPKEAAAYFRAILALEGASAAIKNSARQALAQRFVVVNGVALADDQLRTLDAILGVKIPDNVYWYDRRWGAWGLQGGQTEGFITAGLPVGGALQKDASKGRSGIFANGRELPLGDLLQLRKYNISPLPGKYWVDASFNYGFDGGPKMGNLLQLAGLQGGGSGGGRRGSLLSGSFISGMGVNSAGAIGRDGEYYERN